MNRIFLSFFFVLVMALTVCSQENPFLYDFSQSTEEENGVTITGAGFGLIAEADYSFGAIPTDNAFEGATDGNGLIIKADPGEGVMVFTPFLQIEKTALIRCSIRSSAPHVSAYIATIDQGQYTFVSTITPNNGEFFHGKYNRLADIFFPPSTGFQGLVQIINTSQTEPLTVYIDNLEVIPSSTDDISFSLSEITGTSMLPVATPTPEEPTATPVPPTPTPTLTPTPIKEINGLKIKNVLTKYQSPYLIEYSFSLEDLDGRAVIQDLDLFSVNCYEEGIKISGTETGSRMTRNQKQLKCYLVLDYTMSMADIFVNNDTDGDYISDSIEAMQDSAKNFIDLLRVDSLVGVYEFHQDRPPIKVSELMNDKEYVKNKIDSLTDEELIHYNAGTSRCWDALYAAINEFPTTNEYVEQRFVVFLSNGQDESSIKRPSDVTFLAKSRGVRIYSVGFGTELNVEVLDSLCKATGGKNYTANTIDEIQQNFRLILNDLTSYYTLRWVSLKRDSNSYTPSFSITTQGKTDTYTGSDFIPTNVSGDIKKGQLWFVENEVIDGRMTAFLRAEYIPGNIRKFRFYLDQNSPYTINLVPKDQGGILHDWTLKIEDDPEFPGKWITIESPDPNNPFITIPYAAFGPILQFDFTSINDANQLWTGAEGIRIDNSFYTGGQSFVISGVKLVIPLEPQGPPITVEINSIPLEMVMIPAGTFMMGSPDSELGRESKEGPQHQVAISQPFYMGKYEVTQAQWQAVMGSNPSNWVGGDLPVEQVSWFDVQEFIQKLNQLGQGTFRLPTEAEWEYACRAGTSTRYYWGEDLDGSQIDQYAWYSKNSSLKTHEVGQKLPNAWGLYDMSGNVWEWCQDWYGVYNALAQEDPTGPSSGSFRVIRGVGWGGYAGGCRSAFRIFISPVIRGFGDGGFRLVRSFP